MVYPDNIPGELKSIPNWCVWRREDLGGTTLSKPPYQARYPDQRAYPSVPETWAPFEVALKAFMFGGFDLDGIALAITEDLGIVGVDLDHVSDWADDAWAIVRQLASYTERSPSRNGYRIFVRAEMPAGRRRRDNVEMYGSGRIFSVTGNSLNVSRHLEHRQAQVEAVHHQFLGTEYAHR